MTAEVWTATSVAAGREDKFCVRLRERLVSVTGTCAPDVISRTWDRRRRKWVRTARKLVPGYVFVRSDTLLDGSQVAGVLPSAYPRVIRGSGGAAALVRPADVDKLVELADLGTQLADESRAPPLFVRDGMYTIRQGWLVGEQATCLRSCRSGEANGLFMVRDRRISVPLYLFTDLG